MELRPKTHLEPDVLVLPSPRAGEKEWADFSQWWLAVEVVSRGSRMYDRNIKRDAYLALGVAEVWLVDRDTQEILVSRPGEPADVPHTGTLTWFPRGMQGAVTPAKAGALDLDLAALFAGI